MTNILDNEKVRKYFGCIENGQCGTGPYHDHSAYVSWLILTAMQQPIKKGERILIICTDGDAREDTADRDAPTVHPFDLRLPDRFQPSAVHKKECTCSHAYWQCCPCNPSSAVEEQVKACRRYYNIQSLNSDNFEEELRALVKLAQGVKDEWRL